MKKGSTLILKGTILVIGLLVLAFCTIVLPMGIITDKTGYYRPLLIGMYLPAIPFFIALFQGWKILVFIENNKPFSDSSVRALQVIKYCAASISLFYTLGMPYIFMTGDKDDAPGIVLLGFVIIFASFVVATFAGVLQKLIQKAVDLKSENDLTV